MSYGLQHNSLVARMNELKLKQNQYRLATTGALMKEVEGNRNYMINRNREVSKEEKGNKFIDMTNDWIERTREQAKNRPKGMIRFSSEDSAKFRLMPTRAQYLKAHGNISLPSQRPYVKTDGMKFISGDTKGMNKKLLKRYKVAAIGAWGNSNNSDDDEEVRGVRDLTGAIGA